MAGYYISVHGLPPPGPRMDVVSDLRVSIEDALSLHARSPGDELKHKVSNYGLSYKLPTTKAWLGSKGLFFSTNQLAMILLVPNHNHVSP